MNNFMEIEAKYDYKGNELLEKEEMLINLNLITCIEKNDDDIKRGGMPSVFIEFINIGISNNINLYFPSLEERDKYYNNLIKKLTKENEHKKNRRPKKKTDNL